MTCNLVLGVWDRLPKTVADLTAIAARVAQIDPGVRSFVVPHDRRRQLRLLPLWFQPTLSIVMVAQFSRKLLPGHFMTGRFLGKPGEYRRLDAAGIPVPEWTAIGPDTRLDPAQWGPYVVEKPSVGRVGAYVRIRRTGRVKYQPPESYPAGHFGRGGPMLAQRFIYTGRWPTSYRVVTLFGEVLLCYRQHTAGRGQPLEQRWGFGGGGTSIVSNTKEMIVEMDADPAVIALAERAHREAFPDLALLGFDIVRDVETGQLFVLECHPQGSQWLFSSKSGQSMQRDNKIAFEPQFDALEKSARILARAARRLARVEWPSFTRNGARVADVVNSLGTLQKPLS